MLHSSRGDYGSSLLSFIPAVLLLFFLSFLGAAAPAFSQENEKYPRMKAEPERFDFGDILEGQVLEREVKLTNIGDADLVIKRIEFTCGCSIPKIVLSSGREVVPVYEKTGSYVTLEPGAWAQVKLEFQSLGRMGFVKHRMDIQSNDPWGQVKHIPIEANIKPAFVIDPPSIDFGVLDKAGQASRTVRIESNGIGDFEITGIEDMPLFFEYKQEPVEGGENPARLFTLTYLGGAPVGRWSKKIKVSVKHPMVKTVTMLVEMNIFPAVSFKVGDERIYDFLDLGLMPRGEEKKVFIQVASLDPMQPYLIQRIYCKSNASPPIQASVATQDAGFYVITLDIPPQEDARFLQGSLTIYSGHPDLPVAVLRLKGLYSQ